MERTSEAYTLYSRSEEGEICQYHIVPNLLPTLPHELSELCFCIPELDRFNEGVPIFLHRAMH